MTSEEYGKGSIYRTVLPIESIVAAQINRIMEYRSKKLFEYYEESVDALIDLLPPEIEDAILIFKEENNIQYNITPAGKEKYIRLFSEIKKQLNECNIVWHRGGFLIGHD